MRLITDFRNDRRLIPERRFRILRSCEGGDLRFPATEIFNEGWMLRLLLDAFQDLGITDHPLAFTPGAAWYSEPRLLSPFRQRLQPDPLGEGFTRADASATSTSRKRRVPPAAGPRQPPFRGH